MKKNKQGFTLIELLVVISIIGLLATLSIVALNSARARSRDAKRVADIRQMQTALELFFNEYNIYPASPITMIASGTTVFMGTLPTAPAPADGTCTAGSNTYVYTQDSSGASYHITYCIGVTTGNIPAGLGTATPASIH